MAEVVNLRQARKRRAREAAAKAAEENRTRFGLTRPQKAQAGSERARLLATLDGAKLQGRPCEAEPATSSDGEPEA